MNEPLTIYIVVQPWDYTCASVHAFLSKSEAEECAEELRKSERNGHYVTIQEQTI